MADGEGSQEDKRSGFKSGFCYGVTSIVRVDSILHAS